MLEKRYSVTTRPTSGAMDLNAGKPDAKQAALTAGVALGSIVVMSIGGLITLWSFPLDTFERWSVLRLIGVCIGMVTLVTGMWFGYSLTSVTINLWNSYSIRLDDWHDLELRMYEAQQGTETVHEVSLLELQPNVASHVLLAALAIQYRLRHTDKLDKTPWSVRGLEEKMYLDGSNNSVLIGQLTGTRPEKMSTTLAQLGLVVNRKPGFEGEWLPQNYDDVFRIVARNWSKLR